MGYSPIGNHTSDPFSGFDRARVDPGQTGFFEGRMFRTYDKVNIPVAGSQTYRFTAPINFIVWLQKLTLRSGGLGMAIYDATSVDGGGWTNLPIIGMNRMSERRAPFYTPQITVAKGGTFTNGVELDYFELLSTASATTQASNVSTDAAGGERGLPATTFFMRLSPLSGVNSDSLGVHSLIWEERPASIAGWNAYDGVDSI